MKHIANFEGLKFNPTIFYFKTKKQRSDYFDNLLIENIDKFREKQKEYFQEKLHIIFSHFFIFRMFTIITAILTVFSFISDNVTLLLINSSLTLIFYIFMMNFMFKFKNRAMQYMFTVGLNSVPEFIEILRSEIIKQKDPSIN